MSNALNLVPGKKYKVVRQFLDYNKILHPVGETWRFERTAFLPYEDGLSLFVVPENAPGSISYRFQWTEEEQAFIIRNFLEFVTPC